MKYKIGTLWIGLNLMIQENITLNSYILLLYVEAQTLSSSYIKNIKHILKGNLPLKLMFLSFYQEIFFNQFSSDCCLRYL